MAGTSKTARASSRAGARGGGAKFNPAMDAKTLVSLGGGTNVRIHSPLNGKARTLKVSDPALIDALREITDSGYADKINAEIADLAGKYQAWAGIAETLAAKDEEPVDDAELSEAA